MNTIVNPVDMPAVLQPDAFFFPLQHIPYLHQKANLGHHGLPPLVLECGRVRRRLIGIPQRQ